MAWSRSRCLRAVAVGLETAAIGSASDVIVVPTSYGGSFDVG